MGNSTTKNVPLEVIQEAEELVDMFGLHFKYLGKKENQEVYSFVFPEDIETGYPFVYVYEPGKGAFEITGEKALDIIMLSNNE